MTVTWADAGNPKAQVTLDDARAWAMEYGYVKTNVPLDRPVAQRVDLVAFFEVYNANAFSVFRQKFKSRRLRPPNEEQVRRRPATRATGVRLTVRLQHRRTTKPTMSPTTRTTPRKKSLRCYLNTNNTRTMSR